MKAPKRKPDPAAAPSQPPLLGASGGAGTRAYSPETMAKLAVTAVVDVRVTYGPYVTPGARGRRGPRVYPLGAAQR
jgi:hypothetical protein